MLLVLDTDVVAAGVMSATGASRYLLESVGLGAIAAAASVPLFLEYEAVLKRETTLLRAGATVHDIDTILDQLASVLVRVDIWYLWRPQLRDRDDDMVPSASRPAGRPMLPAGCAPAGFMRGRFDDPRELRPEPMSKSNYPLKAPASILAAARRAAARDGVSLNQFINTALAEKVAALAAEEVFTQRAARADKARFLDVLRRVGPEPPQPGDELPAD